MLPSMFGESLFDDFFDDDFMRFPVWGGRDPLYGKNAKNLMKTDVRETENTYEVDVDLPGFKKDEISVDLKDGFVAIKGWTEQSQLGAEEFFASMQNLGVKTIICTDISRDGAMKGTNLGLYRQLSGQFGLDLIASGGVSSLEDVKALREMNLSGAIIGKAYYAGTVDLAAAVREEGKQC